MPPYSAGLETPFQPPSASVCQASFQPVRDHDLAIDKARTLRVADFVERSECALRYLRRFGQDTVREVGGYVLEAGQSGDAVQAGDLVKDEFDVAKRHGVGHRDASISGVAGKRSTKRLDKFGDGLEQVGVEVVVRTRPYGWRASPV